MKFRYARHTINLDEIIHFYTEILPLEVLGGFRGHGGGYDGVFIGKHGLDWHLEFTASSDLPTHSFDADDNLVFYFENELALAEYIDGLEKEKLTCISNKNDYWNRYGKTYLDPDGHQIVLAYRPKYPLEDRLLKSEDETTKSLAKIGIRTWGGLVQFVQKLPYGRNAKRSDFNLVLSEEKGTCSSKHAFLKSLAHSNHITEVSLRLGIYKMNAQNTNGVKEVLEKYKLDYIPEAHCYLMIDGKRYDYTKADSNISLVEKDLLLERDIEPEDVVSFKIILHKGFLLEWLKKQELAYSFDEIWQIREQCIDALGIGKR